jgi:hypothetical protein
MVVVVRSGIRPPSINNYIGKIGSLRSAVAGEISKFHPNFWLLILDRLPIIDIKAVKDVIKFNKDICWYYIVHVMLMLGNSHPELARRVAERFVL